MTSLQRDPQEAKAMLEQEGQAGKQSVTFDEFISLMQQVENKILQTSNHAGSGIHADSLKKDMQQLFGNQSQ